MKRVSTIIFLLAAKLIKQPEGKGQTKHPFGPPKMMANNSENVRESSLDFTTHFGEISPDKPRLQRSGMSRL